MQQLPRCRYSGLMTELHLGEGLSLVERDGEVFLRFERSGRHRPVQWPEVLVPLPRLRRWLIALIRAELTWGRAR